jgi:Predicted hydrolases or acyltransferases (alpha/beta hydrolase superfamily)
MECELKDITVHYEAFGEGRPIVMLHGWGCDHRHMVSDMEPLFRQRDGWKRIYLDLPGHGRTPGKDWITNRDQELDVVLDFIDAVIPGERFLVASASAGAYLARGLVHHRPAAIDGLLLTVPLIVADDAKRHVPSPVTLVADPALVSELEPDEAEGLFQIAVVQSRKVVEYIRANFPSDGEAGDEAYQEKIREHPENYAFSFDVDALPKPCPAPTLIVTGRQDSVIGYHDAWGILENYPRATFVVLDRSGHFLGVEQEDLFHALAGEWLDRVEECAETSG